MKNLKILIAEDDETSALMLSIMIEKYSNNILIAKNGVEAVQISRENPDIDIIFMDMKMPVLNGYEATKQIREFNKEVVIYAQTAYALAGDEQKVTEAGCDGYITKPININAFDKLMATYIDK